MKENNLPYIPKKKKKKKENKAKAFKNYARVDGMKMWTENPFA